ncbi:isoaspartyl peptidase/L-asparaginase family protein [Candidatus Nitrospira nitrificans]|uniref:isoaspartyl peptidase/L-asparaginase family protein n=1 Tax=Candidatus Nitrospira nitrificans TaxID=1742973 RepID=UPI000B8A52D4|nr:isoaspartyl peptidase/L-asparaginase family protein [Candidatus Nitrospira nitrificans]
MHGGAGSRAMTSPQAACLCAALQVGYHLLDRGSSALVAVEQTIRALEGSGLFNAGTGAHLQLDGARRMDASIMEGESLRAGAVVSIEGVVHPISAARRVMEDTDHVLLVGPMATKFARHFKMERQSFTGKPRRFSYETALRKIAQNREKHGTVGAVALDRAGTVAAGASTGGIDRMLPGRVGDTPIIGCGVYADNETGAVSMTGLGEGIMRLALAKEICDRVGQGKTPATAARLVLQKLVARIHGAAGCLVLTSQGRFTIRHSTSHMMAGYWAGRGNPVVNDTFR